MRLKISHLTHYHYDRAAPYVLQQLRLTPKNRAGQSIINWQIVIEGGDKVVEFDDQHGNRVTLAAFETGRSESSILSEGEVETSDTSGVVGEHGGFAPLWYFQRSTDRTEPGANIRRLVRELSRRNYPNEVARLHALTGFINRRVAYEIGSTDAETTAEAAMTIGKGVCQDHAHIFISAARAMGFPARYVSGYLMMNDRVEQDASHAWAEAHVPDLGWVGFDVSNGISPDERYVRVATGLDYPDAAPVSGVRFGGGDESMVVTLQVQQ